jgi:CubicO group peptidase (beta-lactamase class C family)
MNATGIKRCAGALAAALLWLAASACAHAALDPALLQRIDRFVADEVASSNIPGVALAVLDDGRVAHSRGFGHDGHGGAVTADTPFPIGSLTKSFTALLVRQFIESGQLDADTPVQRVLPWFQLADAQASPRITVRHLLNQTSGFSRADGITPLVAQTQASTMALARAMSSTPLNRPVGASYEYSNLNFVLLGALLEELSGRPWPQLVQERVFAPLAMQRSHTDPARAAGMTALHRYWFGVPLQHGLRALPGMAPAGNLVASANDMARYAAMLLAGGAAPSGRLLTPESVTQLLAPGSPPGHARLLSADFDFRYGEGWFVGPFGAAADARWHLGSLSSFAAWMVLLPETKQAVVLLINANNELPLGDINAALSRLPIGVVNLLRGQPPPTGPSLRSAYLVFDAVVVLLAAALAALAWWAARTRRGVWPALMLLAAVGLVWLPRAAGLSASMLWQFAPDLLLAVALFAALLAAPALVFCWRRLSRARHDHRAGL